MMPFQLEVRKLIKQEPEKYKGIISHLDKKVKHFSYFLFTFMIFNSVLEYITTSTKNTIAEDRGRNYEDCKKRSEATTGKKIT